MSAIFKKELKSFFINPQGYVFLGVYLIFSSLLLNYSTIMASSYSTSTFFTVSLFVLAIFVPLLTMRSFSEEKRSKTEQLLLTSPRSIISIVLGKYLAILTLAVSSFLVSLLNLIPLSIIGASERSGESYSVRHIGLVPAKVIGSLIGIIFIISLFTAIGIFVSTLTENQLVSAIVTIGIIIFLIVISYLNMIGSDESGTRLISSTFIRSIIDFLSVLSRYSPFTLGKISLSSIVYYLSGSFIFLLLSVFVYDRKRYV